MYLLWLLVIIITPAWGKEPVVWHCTATDQQQHRWTLDTPYEKVSQMKVLDRCRKESPIPDTCQAPKAACEMSLNGVTQRPLWQCTAMDRKARIWKSHVFSQKYEAAAAAKADCQHESAIPLSCYVNLITCINLGHSS